MGCLGCYSVIYLCRMRLVKYVIYLISSIAFPSKLANATVMKTGGLVEFGQHSTKTYNTGMDRYGHRAGICPYKIWKWQFIQRSCGAGVLIRCRGEGGILLKLKDRYKRTNIYV